MTETLSLSSVSCAAALAPSPALGFILQIAAVFGAVGALVVLHAEARGRRIDRARTTSAWSTLGLAIGVIVAVGDAVV